MNNKSAPQKPNALSIVIAGDVTMDCNIALSQEKIGNEQNWNTSKLASVNWQRGSVLMLTDLIRTLVKQAGFLKEGENIKDKVICRQDSLNRSGKNSDCFYAKWSLFDFEARKSDKSQEKVWRVEEFLGYQQLDKMHPTSSTEKEIEKPIQDNEEAEIVILDDANLGFRNQENPENWTRTLLNKKKRPWVLIKMCGPVAQGNLWNYLHNNHAEKLIAVLTIDDLRLTDVQISRELSWELTAQDLVRELIFNPSVNSLSDCAFVIVLFGTEGAILFSNHRPAEKNKDHYIMPKSFLFFDPKVIEGMWQQNHPGGIIGYKTCMAASVALSLLQYIEERENADERKKDEESKIEEAIKKAVNSGLLAMRKLHLEGYGKKKSKITETKLAFPNKLIAEQLIKFDKTKTPFVSCEIRPTVSASDLNKQENNRNLWTILGDRYREGLEGVARRIVIEGTENVLNDVPLGSFGKLLTVDRREIENLRSIRTLVSEYVEKGSDKPISIAVFGSPGSGKSSALLKWLNLSYPVE